MNDQNQNYFSIESTLELKFKNFHYRDISYNSFLPGFNKLKTDRSEISMVKEASSIIFHIASSDITAYRASVNEIISFGKIVDNTLFLIENY
ncbi:MAG: KEOPS complex subunit Pcc1 [Candidatus Lokiarchaeota archaeon]